EGEKQSAVLKAEGARTAAILKAEGEAKAIETVFNAIHEGAPDQALLSYQYLQMLPQIAQGNANKVWVIPSEFSQAINDVASRFAPDGDAPRPKPGGGHDMAKIDEKAAADAEEAARAAREASQQVQSATNSVGGAQHLLPPLPPESES